MIKCYQFVKGGLLGQLWYNCAASEEQCNKNRISIGCNPSLKQPCNCNPDTNPTGCIPAAPTPGLRARGVTPPKRGTLAARFAGVGRRFVRDAVVGNPGYPPVRATPMRIPRPGIPFHNPTGVQYYRGTPPPYWTDSYDDRYPYQWGNAAPPWHAEYQPNWPRRGMGQMDWEGWARAQRRMPSAIVEPGVQRGFTYGQRTDYDTAGVYGPVVGRWPGMAVVGRNR